MGKVVKLTENDLRKIIDRIIEEQLAVGQNYQQGQKVGQVAGQQARQTVNAAANKLAQGAKEIVVTIGKVTFNIVIYSGAFLFLIGKGIYKVTAAIGNALLKFLMALGNVAVSTAKALGNAGLSALAAAGVAWQKGQDYLSKFFQGLRDGSASIVKWVVNLFKSLGTAAWAKVLLAAAAVNEWKGMLSTWIKQQYDSIAASVGASWDEAVRGAKSAYNTVASGAKSAYNTVSSGASNLANKASNLAGRISGGIQGFLQEFFERFLSFKGNDTMTILSEGMKFNGLVIL